MQKPSTTTIEINLLGAAYTAHLAFHHLSKNPSKGHKSIVLLGSMCESRSTVRTLLPAS